MTFKDMVKKDSQHDKPLIKRNKKRDKENRAPSQITDVDSNHLGEVGNNSSSKATDYYQSRDIDNRDDWSWKQNKSFKNLPSEETNVQDEGDEDF